MNQLNDSIAMENRNSKFGFTLTEVLVAVVLTLILLGLMIRAFTASGSEIAKGRALLEIAGQLRSTSELLRSDLGGVTATMIPRKPVSSATGYFEYIEGIAKDTTIHTLKIGSPDPSAVFGDVDDILMFTARSLDQPFRGRFGGQIIESNYAEIIWWTVFEDENGDNQFNSDENLRLFRRVLLIRPDLITTATDVGEFWQANDVSARLAADGSVLANSLGDLTDRANRFARAGTSFPHEPDYALLQGSNQFVLSNPTPNGGAINLNEGEDIMLSAVAAFDVRAYDPVAQMRQAPDLTTGLSPSDFGYAAGLGPAGYGAYVDLNIDFVISPENGGGIFTGGPQFPAPDDNSITWQAATYCTWSASYESDGIDQDNDNVIDEGSNRLDDDGANGPDDIVEFETRPPYPYPLRGIQVTLRVVEPSSSVVRQTSVTANFVPE